MNEPALPPSFDRAFRDAVRLQVRGAYRFAAQNVWSPDDGIGPLMFSLGVYFNLTNRFSRIFDSTATLQFTPTMRQAELRGPGGMRVRWNKIGSLPGPLGEIARPSDTMLEMAETNYFSQLTLGFHADAPKHWIIAHAGTPAGGLATIHLAQPMTSKNERKIVGWAQAVPIFDAMRPDLDFPAIDIPGLPEPTELPGLDLRFRTDAGDDAADGGEKATGGNAES